MSPLPHDPTDEEGILLLRLARQAVETYLRRKVRIEPPASLPQSLRTCCGVFVTLNRRSRGVRELRGCIGYPEPTTPVVEATINSAIAAAVEDPRFHPLTLQELPEIFMELSILTPPQLLKTSNPMEYPRAFKLGVDGLVVERQWNRGLLLPQVPVEWGWDEEEFLCHCCLKAGLAPDAWLLPDTKVHTFQAVVYEEEEPAGRIVRRSLLPHCARE